MPKNSARPGHVRSLALILFACCALWPSAAEAASGFDWIDHNTNLTIYADIRLRYELDWDSHTPGGVSRDDRNRGRIRARLGFDYRLSDAWSTGVRVRTGDSRSQQSPHLTFASDDGVRDDLGFVLDRYFVQYKEGPFSGWAGRNTFPFWQQNELFWDDDVTPTGLAGSYGTPLGKGDLTATLGAFYLPDGGYALNGQLLGSQVKYGIPLKPSTLTAAAGIYHMNGETGAENLRNRNGERDYTIFQGSFQWSVPINRRPLVLGADFLKNLQHYSAADVAPLSAINVDQTFGYVLSAQWGQLKQKHDWIIGYFYAHIETLAVNASYAQDDWFRFGNGVQTDSSDFQGHEVRLGYALSKNLNILARLYSVEAITSRQDGNRFRFDLNWKF